MSVHGSTPSTGNEAVLRVFWGDVALAAYFWNRAYGRGR